MLDNERLIYKMLLEQKLRLVTGTVLYKSSPVGSYEFPVVRFSEKPFQGKDVVCTQFPSDRTLASSFDPELIERVFACAGEEARTLDVFDGFYSSNNPKAQNFSSSHYLLSQYLSAKDRGAKGKQPTAHEVVPASFGEEMLRRNLTDTVLSEGAPDIVIVECVEDAEFYLKKQDYHGLVYGVAASPEEAARYFFAGCSFVYLKDNFFSELVSFFDSRTKNYRVAFGEYKEKQLSLKELDRRTRVLDIFDEGIIDNACDRTINFLKRQKKAEIKVSEEKTPAEESKLKNRNEENSLLARRAARESVVLLKNTNHFLPVKRGMKVALVGEYLENYDFQRETFAAKPTKSRLPIETARDFGDLNVTGYAVGYRKGEGVNEELFSNAARLASSADCTVIFLSADPKTGDLPENQKLLVKTLLGWNISVVAVISADRCVDTNFADGCQAILYTGRGGQESAAAVFELLTGEYSPSGKLSEPVDGAGGYPFGYGLTYTEFEYRDLKIDESGVSVIVENKGGHDACAVVQLYLQKDGSMYADKTLKGFSKEFIKKGDVVRVTIPFTENTFRYYDEDKKKYRTQGGEYNLYISESATADKLTGTVKIASDDGDRFTNTLAEASADGTKASFSESKGVKEKKGMPFGLKLFLVISLFLYYNAVMVLLLAADFVPVERTVLFYALVGAATGVIDILFLVCLIVVCVKRWKPLVDVNDSLSDMVDKVDEFVEIAKLTYPDPVKEKEKAKKAQEEEERRKAEEEKKEKEREEKERREAEQAKENEKKAENKQEGTKKDASEKPVSAPSLDKPGDYPETDSFEKMTVSLRRYLMERGINIGAGSARRLLAAIASSRLVLVTSKNAELLPDFMNAVNSYFGGLGVSFAEDKWNTIEDLLWKEVSGRNVFSSFTNSAVDASRRHNKNAVAVIGNVSSENLADWLAEIVDFAASPSEAHKIVLNSETKFALPQNFCSLLFAKENGFDTELSREVLNVSLIIDISIRKADGAEEGGPSESAVSYPNFCTLVREAREKYFLSEKNWAKIDALFEFINTNDRLPFGNKNTLMSEKFTSVLMACGAEESEALTSLLRFKIIPLLKTSRLYEQEDGITLIYEFLQKTFPDEDLTKVKKVLSERPKKVEEKTGNAFYTPGFTDVHETASEPIYAQPPAEEVPASEPIYAQPPEEEVPASERIYAQPPEEEVPASEPIYAQPPEEEVPASEPIYVQPPEEEIPASEPIYAQPPAEESAFFESNQAAQTPDYESGASAYDNSYQNNSESANVYEDYGSYGGYQQESAPQNEYYDQSNYEQNSYDSAYTGYSDGYGEYQDGYRNDGYDYGNGQSDEWDNNGGGENK